MRHALSIPPFADPRTITALGVEAEAAGWDGVFLWDHLQWDPTVRADVHDPWVVLGAIAYATERVALGTLVTPLARRRPVTVAKQMITLDHLSGGRAVLGVGLGVPHREDFSAFGEIADPRERAAVLDDHLAAVDGLLRGGPFSYDGAYTRVVDADLRPGPVQQPRPPIWVAGLAPNRRPLERARRWDGFVPLVSGPDARLTPEALAAYAGTPPRDGWDLVAHLEPGVPPGEYADVGVTWLVQSVWPTGSWVDDLAALVRGGPAA